MENWFEDDEIEFDVPSFTSALVNISKLAKYWASSEISKRIYRNVRYLDVKYYGQTGLTLKQLKYLTQLLKREWFR